MIFKTYKIRILIILLISMSMQAQKNSNRLNVLLITADDLGYEAVNSFGRNIPNLTPQMDKFAKEGVQFMEGHTITPICQPSRSVMATGLYGVSSGMMGFMHKKKDVATAMETFQENGYLTGILGKVKHSTPPMDFKWDFMVDYGDLGSGRSPKKYSTNAKLFIEKAQKEGKPFYFMVNSHDPHRQFHNPNKKDKKGAEKPSRIFSIDEVEVPAYLPNTTQVKKEISYYYNSVRRFDDTFGAVIKVLKKSGVYENTIIVVLSDNGSPFPFAKANSYVASTKTPFYVHYPGHMKKGLVDTEHMVTEADLFPTFLDAAGIKVDQEFDGKSFLSLLKGKKQKGRDFSVGEIDYKIGGVATPIRSYGTKKHRYIFNGWGAANIRYANSNEGDIIKDIEKNNRIEYSDWVQLYRYRVPEEFFDLEKDPDAVHNLIDDPEYADVIQEYRDNLKAWMIEKNDPAISLFENIGDARKRKDILKNEFPSKESLMCDEQLEEIRKKIEAKKSKKNKKKKKKE